jgi:hypothetical protein
MTAKLKITKSGKAAKASPAVTSAVETNGNAKKAAVKAHAGTKVFIISPQNLGEKYIAVCRNQKADGGEFIVRTTTDFDAVSAAGRSNPNGTWSIKDRFVDDSIKFDCDVSDKAAQRGANKASVAKIKDAKLKKSPRWIMGYENMNALPIQDFSGKAKDLPKSKKKGVVAPTDKDDYDVLCWQVLLNTDKESSLKRMAITVAAWGQAHGKAWWADVAEKYLPMAARDMKAAGLKPRL